MNMLLVVLYGGILLSTLFVYFTWRDMKRPGLFLYRHKVLGYCLIILFAAAIICGLCTRLLFPNLLVTKTININLPNLNAPIKIAFVSDLQVGMGKKTEWVKRVVRTIEKTTPDAVIIGGDLIDNEGKQNEEQYLEPLFALASKYPIYYVMGNHEYGIGGTTRHDIDYQTGDRSADVRQYLAGRLTELNNQAVIVSNREGDDILVFGFDDIWHQPADYDKYRISVSNSVLDTVVVSHNPDIAHNWPLDVPKPQIVISGHTHGGQVRLPFLGPLADAKIQLGDKYYSGLNYYHNIPIYTSVGAGESAAPIRFLTVPEIVVFDLY